MIVITFDTDRRVDFAIAPIDNRWWPIHLLHLSLLRGKYPNMQSLSQVLNSLVDAIHRIVFGYFEMRAALQGGRPIWTR